MTPDLEEMIRHRAHEIWEQEGRSHGRHEEHWQRAASEITQELERIKAQHTPATAEEIEAPIAPRRGRPRRTEAAEPATAPRKRGRKAAGEAQPEAAVNDATTTRRRVAKGTEGAQSEPATEGDPKPRRRKSQATEASSDANTPDRPARRGRKPKAESDTMQ